MSIGYACLTIGVPHTGMKGCLLRNATPEKLSELTQHNLNSLENIIDYNIQNEIRLFRISSDLIPFGSSPANKHQWWEMFDTQLNKSGEKIRAGGMRVSMHPGQYTVLNSPDSGVVKRALEELHYSACLLDSLGTDPSNKIILHVGGVYGNKPRAMARFAEQYKDLDEAVKRRLVIENDDTSYHINDVLELGAKLTIPVVYDNLHNLVNPSNTSKNDLYWISAAANTWRPEDGVQKIHYSQQDKFKKAGSHSESISINEFMDFYQGLGKQKPDIMLEVKDKNLSAVKCILCTAEKKNIKALELEWSHYKYRVLEQSPQDYNEIRALLKNKATYPALAFYHLIQNAAEQEPSPNNRINAALHIWGYFKHVASEKEKTAFFKKLQAFEKDKLPITSIKRTLWRMAEKYQQDYLLASYYFIE